ncbi:MAG: hypothetical protein HONBIEJF_00875 [Fimbriimonadaceae bacterium]|nr:hypothetical protein [Fimbriimonadaceae bacterium]
MVGMTIVSTLVWGTAMASSTITQVAEIIDVRLHRAFAGKWGRRVSGDIRVKVGGRDVTVVIEPFHTRFGRDLDLRSGELVEIDHGLEGSTARIERSQIRRAD